MTRRAGVAGAKAQTPPPQQAPLLESLLDIRDGLAEAKNLAAATWLACGSPSLDRDTAAALSALTNITRGQLEDLLDALDTLIASVTADSPKPHR